MSSDSMSSTSLGAIINPFRDTVVGDPWNARDDSSDVSEIHQEVFQLCLKAVEDVRHGNSSYGIAIHGAPGSGKTHLIRRLRHRLIDAHVTPDMQRLSHAFAYIRLNTGASMLAQHVQRCVATDLLRTNGTVPNQLERMVISRLMEVAVGDGDLQMWWDFFLTSRLHELDSILQTLQSRENLSPDFVRVLNHLIRKQHRLDVAGWFRGDVLSDAARVRLDIGPVIDEVDPEDSAKRMLLDFMRLAGRHVPLVLCFDQVEALQTDPGDTHSFFLFGKLVAELADADPNLVLISCLQTSRHEQLSQAVPGYALARLQGGAVRALDLLTVKQATAILTRRLEFVPMTAIRPDGASCLWPLTGDEVNQFVGRAGITPRQLLEAAAKSFDAKQQRRPEQSRLFVDWIDNEWDRRMEHAMRLDAPAKEILTHALPLLLRVAEPAWKSPRPNEFAKVIDHIFSAPDKACRVGVKVCEDSPVSLAAQLRKLSTLHPSQTGLQQLLLLRDERKPIGPNAKMTWQHIAALEERQSRLVHVEPETLAVLDAMRQLIADAQSGDLAFEGGTVSEERVLEWLRKNLPHPLKEFVDILTNASARELPQDYLQVFQEWIQTQRITRWDVAARTLAFPIEQQNQILNQLRERGDLFRVLDGDPVVVISARLQHSEAAELPE